MKKIALLIIILSISGCHPYRGFIEAEFALAADSPLPAWFPEIPDGYKREDLKIRMRYYAPPWNIDNTVFWVEGNWLRTIYKGTGKSVQHPKHEPWQRADWNNRRNPSFVIVTIDGKTEIIEHKKMEPFFYVSSENEVKKTMGKDY